MDAPPKNRTVKPNGDTISRLRKAKGWRVEDLALKARCSVKTVEKVERGADVYLLTLNRFATALGVEYAAVVLGGDLPPEPPKPQSTIQMQFVLSIPFQAIDKSERVVAFIEFLKQFMLDGGDIDVISVRPGSTIITVEMSLENMLALLTAYSEGKLRGMLCHELRFKYNPVSIKDSIVYGRTPSKGSTSKKINPRTGKKIVPQQHESTEHIPDSEQ